MHSLEFLQDLAAVMVVAGLVTILFHRFKQPVVLGYGARHVQRGVLHGDWFAHRSKDADDPLGAGHGHHRLGRLVQGDRLRERNFPRRL